MKPHASTVRLIIAPRYRVYMYRLMYVYVYMYICTDISIHMVCVLGIVLLVWGIYSTSHVGTWTLKGRSLGNWQEAWTSRDEKVQRLTDECTPL